jgi:hypothetical protein
MKNIENSKKTDTLEPGVLLNETELKLPPKLDEFEKLKVKQRMINFTMNIFDRFDIKKILIFWMEQRKSDSWKKRYDRIKESSQKMKNAKINETTKNGDKQDGDEKKKTKKDMYVKQNYVQPNDTIKKYIPFCSNIYNIQRNEN